jgi:hypothetical protein
MRDDLPTLYQRLGEAMKTVADLRLEIIDAVHGARLGHQQRVEDLDRDLTDLASTYGGAGLFSRPGAPRGFHDATNEAHRRSRDFVGFGRPLTLEDFVERWQRRASEPARPVHP